MRMHWSLAVFATTLAVGGVAQAQQAVNPYNGPIEAVTPQPEQPEVLNPYPAPVQVQPVYPPPTVVYPVAPPVYAPPPPPVYTPPYYVYPPPRVYVPPYRQQLRCVACARRPAPVWDGARRFSLGVDGTVMGLNQKVGNDSVVLGGAGIHFRFRSRGRFGLELMQSFLHADYWNGNFQRNSYPFQMSLMLYLMPNDDRHHFNLYGLVGFGVMFDSVKIFDNPTQDFVEWEGHFGLGAELRIKWFAIAVDGRMLGLLRDDSSGAAGFYTNVQGAPIPGRTWGATGNVLVSVWF